MDVITLDSSGVIRRTSRPGESWTVSDIARWEGLTGIAGQPSLDCRRSGQQRRPRCDRSRWRPVAHLAGGRRSRASADERGASGRRVHGARSQRRRLSRSRGRVRRPGRALARQGHGGTITGRPSGRGRSRTQAISASTRSASAATFRSARAAGADASADRRRRCTSDSAPAPRSTSRASSGPTASRRRSFAAAWTMRLWRSSG